MILVTGSLAFDQIMDFPGKFSDHILPDKIHTLNVSFLVHSMRKGFGGTAGNIAYTLSLLGYRCAILGLVGDDFFPYKEFLDKNEVDTSYIKVLNKHHTSTAFGITDKSDNQIWGFYEGADSLSNHLSINEIKGKIDFGVIAPHNPKAMLNFVGEYYRKKIPYLFDPGMQLRYLDGDDLKLAFTGATVIIGNDYEIEVMQRKTNISNLHKYYKNKIIITTLGEKGSMLSQNGELIHIKAAQVRNISDPAGAGDAYRSGYIAGFMRKFPLKTCGQMGSVAAAYTVEKYGTTTHSFTVDEFVRRYKDNYREDLNF